ncbi:MAG: protein-glutamate O-methyltransferase CheR [Gammaproteobacteria bacterium]|nr:protein-glutamate O-methyltransferase CheR [Gammaproteobacteria bacterium]MCW8986916.1 protein-glutamate O-methyltransferase CheR [Gammaproteobacteria bacterium]MCW9031393.1 protein-glutamate O-methyltransferase CheR [Gammaproteobacteria bacterium]
MSQTLWQLNELMPMSNTEYALWLKLLEDRTGITLPELRKSFLLSKLSIRMQELGITDYKSYFAYVTHGKAGRVEWEILVDRLTIHETRFFRDAKTLSFIKHAYLEKLNFEQDNPSIHIWSVGCATGEEPYSLMMYIDKYMADKNEQCYLAVTASDISHDALAVGKKAVYHQNRFTNVPEEYINHYLENVGKDHYLVNDSLRKRICFNRLNFINLDSSTVGKMDIIICQNVLIYFKRETRIQILNQLVKHLLPGGVLILGAGEITGWQHPEINAVKYNGVLAFQRVQSQLECIQQPGYDA